MKTNLIQNYILTQNGNSIQTKEAPKKPMPEFSIKNELDNRTFIKPLPGKGRLVKNNIFYAPINMVKTFAYDIKSLKHAVKGEANDHELGKLNDVGMKLGGLAIAAYLFSQKQTPKTKAMEFVGLASFFTSMVLWKKLGIQLPAKLIHGVNVDQQYEDSFGRKKPFYLDPQFLPWDLYNDDKINRIGDRLGVPRDIPNRREFIQEKMKKIAVQNNTLWMLTAGFATPVMSALICNGLEKPLERLQDKYYNAKADKLLENADSKYGNFRDETSINKLNRLLELNSDKPLTEKVFNELAEYLTEDFDLNTAQAIKEDLKAKIFTDEYTIKQASIRNIIENINNSLKLSSLTEKEIESIIPNEEQLNKLFEKFGYMKKDAKISTNDIPNILTLLSRRISKNADKLTGYTPEAIENIKDIVSGLVIAPEADVNPIAKGLKTVRNAKLDGKAQAIVKDLANIFTDFNSKIGLFDKYAYLKAGAAPETAGANYFNESVNQIIKLMNFTPDEISRIRLDRELVADLMQTKIEKICANTQDYNNFVTELVKRMAHLDTVIKPSDVTNRYDKLVNNAFNDIASKLQSSDRNMPKTIEALIGKEVWENGQLVRKPNGSLRNIQLEYFHQRIFNMKNTFKRFLCMMDYNRRIATLTNIPALHANMNRELKEEIVEVMKLMTLKGHASDFATKFYYKRNPNPTDVSDRTQIEVENGKFKPKYLGKEGVARVDIPHNPEFFDESMKLVFENPIHGETETILRRHGMLEDFNRYRSDFINYIGKDDYFVKPNHKVWGQTFKSSANERANILGAVPDEMASKAVKQIFNSKKWLKMFGGFGIGLLSATVIAQFFFGKMKTPQRIQQQKGSN